MFDFTTNDFTQIKENLILYFKNQDQFKDWDFAGSGLNMIMDFMTYTLFYNRNVLNLNIDDLFLSYTRDWNIAVVNSKNINYKAKLPVGSNSRVVIKNNTDVDKTIYSFQSITNEPTKFIDNNGLIWCCVLDDFGTTYTLLPLEELELSLYQIESKKLEYTFNAIDNFQYYLPRVDEIDNRSVKVFVENETLGGYTEWYDFNSKEDNYFDVSRYQNIKLADIDNTSKIYFTDIVTNNKLKITFGNGNFGKIPVLNSNIIIKYGYTKILEGNGATNFVPNVDGVDLLEVLNIGSSGEERESIESIKYKAPLYNRTLDTAITDSDFFYFISRSNLDIKQLNVWGGGENNPPIIGKILYSGYIEDYNGENVIFRGLSKFEQQQIENIFSDKTFEVSTLYKKPIPVYLDLNIIAQYNTNILSDIDNIKLKIDNKVTEFFTNFNNENLRIGKLNQQINNFSEIENSYINFNLMLDIFNKFNYIDDYGNYNQQLLKDYINGTQTHYFYWNLEQGIRRGTLQSSLFNDDGNGNILDRNNVIIGKVNYFKGIIDFSINISDYDVENIIDHKIKFKTDEFDFVFIKELFCKLNSKLITLRKTKW